MKKPFLSENIKKKLSPKQWMFFWYRHYKLLFFIGFLIVFGYGSYSWYQYLYRYQWNDQEKKEFLESNFKETAFKENKFKELVQRLNDRAEEGKRAPQLRRDIIMGKGL